MIGYLNGVLIDIGKEFCVIDVHGVGYNVYCTKSTLKKMEGYLSEGNPVVKIHTKLIHREEVLDLYGFLDKGEYDFFNLLITVNGIGPKQSIRILGNCDYHELAKAIVSGDSGFLTTLSGVGEKKAKQMILELREKIKKVFDITAGEIVPSYIEAMAALEALGFTKKESKEAVEKVISDGEGHLDTEGVVEGALKHLSSH